jgi:hypothetical protein
MAVNLALIPAKGMTLPFISYGGSSMISLAYGMGMLLAFTRERPRGAALLQRIEDDPGTAGVPRTAGVSPASPAVVRAGRPRSQEWPKTAGGAV